MKTYFNYNQIVEFLCPSLTDSIVGYLLHFALQNFYCKKRSFFANFECDFDKNLVDGAQKWKHISIIIKLSSFFVRHLWV